ncbi:MAG: hypothetical protein GX193_06990 [Clostridiales bacterium]|nr:hypothetical protein [Clostridiales bacterium]
MSHIDPKMKKHFDSLSPDLQKAIMDKGVTINTLQDLIRVLEQIVDEAE